MTELRKKITTETLLKKVPVETCWAITTKTLWRFIIFRMMKTSTPFLGKDDGILSLLSGWEKEVEIKARVWEGGAKTFFPFVKQTFNIPVEDSVGAVKLAIVAGTFVGGPEWEYELVEATPERAVLRLSNCPVWECWFKDFEVDPGLIPCPETCPVFQGGGVKAVNPKIVFKLAKAMPRGDSCCEWVYEFK